MERFASRLYASLLRLLCSRVREIRLFSYTRVNGSRGINIIDALTWPRGSREWWTLIDARTKFENEWKIFQVAFKSPPCDNFRIWRAVESMGVTWIAKYASRRTSRIYRKLVPLGKLQPRIVAPNRNKLTVQGHREKLISSVFLTVYDYFYRLNRTIGRYALFVVVEIL